MIGEMKKITLLIMLVLFVAGNMAVPCFASTSISARVYCRVPHIITLSDELKESSKEEITENYPTSQPEQITSSLDTENSESINQKEEIISEDGQELEIINTVCAR